MIEVVKRRVLALALVAAGCGGTTPSGTSDAGQDSGGGTGIVAATVTFDVLLANNYPQQLHPLFRADLASGSALARTKLFAKFCNDAACTDPIALIPVDIPGADANGEYVLSSAGVTGTGFGKTVSIAQAPAGTHFMQLVGDTELSRTRGLGTCSSTSDCPGDFDSVSIAGFSVSTNNDGSVDQPAPSSVSVTVSGAGANVTLPTTIYLGHLHFERGPLATPAPSDTGKLVVAMSNATDTYRNRIGIVDLANASSHPGALGPSSYQLQSGSADLAGDVCGMVRGGGSLYALTVSNAGAQVFRLDGTTGVQSSTTPVATLAPSNPNDPNTYPHACRGVYASIGGHEHLYLLEFAGAGSLPTSGPYPIYDVDLTAGTFATPITDTNLALRAIAIDSTNGVYVVDMSYSQSSINGAINKDRIAKLTLDATGVLGGPTLSFTTTDVASNEPCGATNKWPSGAAIAVIGGNERLLVGHDLGIAVYDPAALGTKVQDLSLVGFGQLFGQITTVAGASRVYAMPQCKTLGANSTFTLPYGAPGSTETADENLVAILSTSGSSLAVATTTIDIDANATPDHGIDLDYYFLKAFIREHGSTLPIPPVVYTGPQMAVGGSMLFVRGSGIQGNGSSAVSSSGMGQAQDFSFFDLSTGRGVVFGGYVPWLHGLSSGGGTLRGIWGYDVDTTREASVGWIEYLP